MSPCFLPRKRDVWKQGYSGTECQYVFVLQCDCGKWFIQVIKKGRYFLCASGKLSLWLHTLNLNVYRLCACIRPSDKWDESSIKLHDRLNLVIPQQKSIGAYRSRARIQFLLHNLHHVTWEKREYDQNRNNLIHCTDRITLQGIFSHHRFAFQTRRSILC